MKPVIRKIVSALMLGLIFVISVFGSSNDAKSLQEISISDFNWDIAVSHGNRVTLMSLLSNQSFELTFPMPKLGNNSNRSDVIHVVSLDPPSLEDKARQLTYTKLEIEWPNLEIIHLVSNASENLLYFTHLSKSLRFTNLCVFNISSNETKLLLQTFAGSIDWIVLHEGDLYFSEDRTQTLMKLKTLELASSQTQSSLLPKPIVVKNFNETQVTGIAIDPMTGILYWSSGKPGPSSISYIAEGEVKVLLSKYLNDIHGLAIFNSYLYFINTPRSGLENKIERVSLTNSSDREIVIDFNKQNQLPFTITILCGSIYWTDTVTKALWTLPLASGSNAQLIAPLFTSTNRNQYLSILVPYAVIRRNEMDPAGCVSMSINQEIHSPVLTPPRFKLTLLSSVFKRRCEISDSCEACMALPECTWATNKVGIYSGWCFSINHRIPPGRYTYFVKPGNSCPARRALTPAATPVADQPSVPQSQISLCTKDESDTNCLNNATCLRSNDLTFCLCPVGFAGQRCEFKWNQEPVNASFRTLIDLGPYTPNNWLIVFTITIGGIAVLLAIATVCLGIKVWSLSQQKPKIRRRFIVNTGKSRAPSTSVCEMIDIENCCNMNVCETPCYNSVTGGVSLGLAHGHGDKERLLQC